MSAGGGPGRSSEVLAFVFTDIQGSTRLARELGPGWPDVLADHYRLLRDVVVAHGGTEMSNSGDGLFLTFPSVAVAADACLDGQRALRRHSWPVPDGVLVRMGLHVGSALRVGGDLVGLAVHQAARIMDAAHGGQVLLSARAAADVRAMTGLQCEEIGAFRLKDFDEPQVLWELTADDLPRTASTARAASALDGRLPTWRTTLVGRELAEAHLADLIVSESLVTLVGPGGAGKTRLAVAAAARVAPEFSYDVSFVDLAAVDDPALVAVVAAQALQVRLESRDAEQALREQLLARTALVVLDNCEHVLDAVADLVAVLLQAGPRITVLATSRAPLEMTEEQTVDVAPLPTPADAGELSTSPAGALFLSRLHRPLEPQEASDAVELLSVLDGLPLAVELAAGAARTVGVANALRQARRGPAALPPTRGAVSRHRSMSAALDWSHRLLGEDERVALRRLSVFSGGFREDVGVRVVIGAGALDADRASVALAHLVAASLVSVGSPPARRLRLLETIGAYAAQKLVDPAERAAVQSAHLDLITELAETSTLEELDAELPNVRAAVAYGVEQEDVRAVQLASAMAPYWQLRGLWTEGRFWLERSLAVAPDAPYAARAWARLGALCRRAGDASAAELAARTALAMEPEQATETEALVALGGALQSAQRLEEAEQVYRRALEQAQAIDDRAAAVLALRSLTAVQYERRDFTGATVLGEQALELARAHGDPYVLGPVLNGLGAVLVADGRPAEGRALLEEGLAVRRRGGDVPGEAATLLNLADAMHRAGEYHASLEVAHASFTLWTQLGEPHLAAAVAGNLAGTLLELGEGRAACVLLGAALSTEYRYPTYAREEYEAVLVRARELLGDEACERSLETGRQLGLQGATESALSGLSVVR